MKKTMTVILVKDVKYGWTHIRDYSDAEWFGDQDAIISKPLEVEFDLLPEQDLTEKRVAIIDKEISKVRASLEVLEQRKQEILSLPAPEGE